MTTVYAFMFCHNIFDSGLYPLSLHKTKRGALKAQIEYLNKFWEARREEHVRSMRHVKNANGIVLWSKGLFYSPLEYTSYVILPVELQE